MTPPTKFTLRWTRPDPADATKRDGPFTWTVFYATRDEADRVRDAVSKADAPHGHKYEVVEVRA